MKTIYRNISFQKVTQVLMQSAMGLAAIYNDNFIITDMVYSLDSFLHRKQTIEGVNSEYYFAIRKHGVESGDIDTCISRCEILGCPVVVAKVEKDFVGDYELTIGLAKCEDIIQMEEELNSL